MLAPRLTVSLLAPVVDCSTAPPMLAAKPGERLLADGFFAVFAQGVCHFVADHGGDFIIAQLEAVDHAGVHRHLPPGMAQALSSLDLITLICHWKGTPVWLAWLA